MNTEHTFSTTVGNQVFTFATGKLAGQAGGAVTIQVGDSMLLATATMSATVREGLNFFPLSVDFEEKIYAAGRIPGSFFRREGRPTTDSILAARLTDRPLRPLFPDGMRNEVQVIVTALSSDSVNHLDIMMVNSASAALVISDIPWNGPIGAVRVGYIDNKLVANPTIPELENSQLDLRLAASRDAIIMVEAGANEVTEELMLEALAFGHEAIQPLIDLQLEMREAVGKPKREVDLDEMDPALKTQVQNQLGDRMHSIVSEHTDRDDRNEAVSALREEIIEYFTELDTTGDDEVDLRGVREVINYELKTKIRNRILYDGVRPDGRDNTTIRTLSSEVGISPRAHGSGLFQRGETQVLSIATLGTPREAQKLDGLHPRDTVRFMHHYNFPPYSTGETWFLRGPKRREIGHGELAATALTPIIPSEEDFPYTIRVVSEVLSSNGSTSQASICAACLALMDCGVPVSKLVAGVAMGLITDGEKYAILTDIQGLEDHLGDMDFKVAGTRDGITALQMDIKISGLSKEIMAEALAQAHKGRMEILDSMAATMPEAREKLSQWAPRMETIKIDPDKIGALIGKGGATIRGLQETFEVTIDVQEDGTVFVAGVDGTKTDACLEQIEMLTKGVELGTIYTGKVLRIIDFGLFVELLPGTDGFIHISQLAQERVNKIEDVVQLGDEVMAMVTQIEESSGKVRLSRRAVLEGWSLEEAIANDQGSRRSSGGGRGGNNRGGGRGGNRGNNNNNRRR
ncbi:MAG TPA: polyribonucleotide nucleotidyltransferase [Anaerolineae bacterium]|nr:polyribonucleotide nucleotidyltransferase [Anaerolineae bacterium]